MSTKYTSSKYSTDGKGWFAVCYGEGPMKMDLSAGGTLFSAVAIFPFNNPRSEDEARHNSFALCKYLNDKQEFAERATQAFTVASRMEQ